MLEWITKYWLEVLFGLICSGAAVFVRHYVKLNIKDKQRREQDMLETIDKKFEQQREDMKEQIAECYSNLIQVVKKTNQESAQEDKKLHSEVNAIKDGMLSVQGRAFKADCRRLLEENHVISLTEYEAILDEHIVYNDLGGNHEGDGLFSMVEAKYRNQFTL